MAFKFRFRIRTALVVMTLTAILSATFYYRSPDRLFNLGKQFEASGQYDESMHYYDAFIAAHDGDPRFNEARFRREVVNVKRIEKESLTDALEQLFKLFQRSELRPHVPDRFAELRVILLRVATVACDNAAGSDDPKSLRRWSDIAGKAINLGANLDGENPPPVNYWSGTWPDNEWNRLLESLRMLHRNPDMEEAADEAQASIRAAIAKGEYLTARLIRINTLIEFPELKEDRRLWLPEPLE